MAAAGGGQKPRRDPKSGMSELAAVLLDRSLRLSEHETALEAGWLLAELEQRFGYGLGGGHAAGTAPCGGHKVQSLKEMS